jgi:hypothetical protein
MPSKSRVMIAAFAEGAAISAAIAIRVFMLRSFVKDDGK